MCNLALRQAQGGSGLGKAFFLLRLMAAARILKGSAIAGTLVLLLLGLVWLQPRSPGLILQQAGLQLPAAAKLRHAASQEGGTLLKPAIDTAKCPPPPDCGVLEAVAAKQECPPEKECVVPELNACPPCEPAAAAQPNGTTVAPGSQAPLPTWRSSPHVAATDHNPGLSAIQMQKSIVSLGATSRARRALAKLLAGEPISVAFIGGSSTW